MPNPLKTFNTMFGTNIGIGTNQTAIPKESKNFWETPIGTLLTKAQGLIPQKIQTAAQSAGQGVIESQTYGLYKPKVFPVENQGAYTVGSILGLFNPLNPANKVMAGIDLASKARMAATTAKVANPLMKFLVKEAVPEAVQTAALTGGQALTGQKIDPIGNLLFGVGLRGVSKGALSLKKDIINVNGAKYIDPEEFAKTIKGGKYVGVMNIDDIVIPKRLKGEVNPSQIDIYKTMIDNGDNLNPIVVKNGNVLDDGFHRISALRSRGINQVPVINKSTSGYTKDVATGLFTGSKPMSFIGDNQSLLKTNEIDEYIKAQPKSIQGNIKLRLSPLKTYEDIANQRLNGVEKYRAIDKAMLDYRDALMEDMEGKWWKGLGSRLMRSIINKVISSPDGPDKVIAFDNFMHNIHEGAMPGSIKDPNILGSGLHAFNIKTANELSQFVKNRLDKLASSQPTIKTGGVKSKVK